MASKKRKGKASPSPTEAPAIGGQVIPFAKKVPGVISQEFAWLAKGEMREHPKNPKKGNVDAIGESVEDIGFYGTIYVQKSSGFILAGNHRFRASVAKGIEKFPVMVIDCDDDTAEKILLGDNRLADLGTYDQHALANLLESRAKEPGGLVGTGYAEADLERLRQKLHEPPPSQFPEIDEHVGVHYTCPRCGFAWS